MYGRTAVLVAVVALAGGLAGAVVSHLMRGPTPIQIVREHEVEVRVGSRDEYPGQSLRLDRDAGGVGASRPREVDQTSLDSLPAERNTRGDRRPADERLAEEIDVHRSSTRDPVWARQSESAFTTDFEAVMGVLPVELHHLDCRTDTCLANLQFADYGSAMALSRDVMHHSFTMNCGMTMVIPPPGNPDVPYRGNLLFRCPREAGGR